jgi:hypothetical protein
MGVDPKNFSPGNLHSFNRYGYGNNNPYKYVDPDGRATVASAALFVLTAYIVTVAVFDQQQQALRRQAAEGSEGSEARNGTLTWGPIFDQNPTAEGILPVIVDSGNAYSKPKNPPDIGPPNGWIQGPRKGRQYGPDGKPQYDIDKPHQGEPEDHVHEWPDGEREHPGRPISPIPQKPEY